MIGAGTARWVHWLKLVLGRTPAADDSDRRFVAITRGASTALAARGVALLTGFLLVPLTVGHLGAERYGAWVTISSMISWLAIADLGLGNGLTGALSEAHGEQRADLAQRHVATAFWMLAAIAAVCGVLFGAVFARIDWAALLNVRSAQARVEVAGAAAVALAFFLISLPLGVTERVYAAWREGPIANFWSAAGSIAALAAVYVATRTAASMVVLVLALAGGRFLVQAVSGAWLFRRDHPELRPAPAAVARSSLRRLANTGGLFFIVQIAALILFNTDNVIITRVLGPGEVTPYSVTWTLFTLPSMAITLAFPYLWPAYSEALARKDLRWLERTFRASLEIGLGIAVALAIPLVLFGEALIAAWAGAVAVPSAAVLAWMGVWSVLSTGMNALACLLNAAGQVTGQAIYGTATAFLNIALSIAWGRAYGTAGVIAATVFSYLACAVIPASIEAARLFARLRAPVEEP